MQSIFAGSALFFFHTSQPLEHFSCLWNRFPALIHAQQWRHTDSRAFLCMAIGKGSHLSTRMVLLGGDQGSDHACLVLGFMLRGSSSIAGFSGLVACDRLSIAHTNLRAVSFDVLLKMLNPDLTFKDSLEVLYNMWYMQGGRANKR